VTKKALILGITGQDGSYLAEILTGRGCEVHGMVRHTSGDNLFRLRQLPCFDKLILWKGDMLDSHSVDRLMLDIRPDEVYNEADQDNIDFSYKTPTFSAQITFEGFGYGPSYSLCARYAAQGWGYDNTPSNRCFA